jgi:uncharacterized membrane protein YphA (DoxX/SURF4 family)
MSKLTSVIKTEAPAATVIIRIMVGAVFISEGIQKFINPADVGAGRFAKIGLPTPEFLAPLVGGLEIACGALVLFGVLTRLAACGHRHDDHLTAVVPIGHRSAGD